MPVIRRVILAPAVLEEEEAIAVIERGDWVPLPAASVLPWTSTGMPVPTNIRGVPVVDTAIDNPWDLIDLLINPGLMDPEVHAVVVEIHAVEIHAEEESE